MNDITVINSIVSGSGLNARATGANGFHIYLENGYRVSIQWGAGTYSDNHDDMSLFTTDYRNTPLQSTTAEVAVIDLNGNLIETPFEPHDTVIGWCTPEKVIEIIKWAMSLGGGIETWKG